MLSRAFLKIQTALKWFGGLILAALGFVLLGKVFGSRQTESSTFDYPDHLKRDIKVSKEAADAVKPEPVPVDINEVRKRLRDKGLLK